MVNIVPDLISEIDALNEYKEAYYYLVYECWENCEKKHQKEMNKDLNKIFILNKDEIVEV